jgi:alanine racemase
VELSWIEISKSALAHNIKSFRGLIGKDRVLGVAVKANAYGHGLLECSKIFLRAGADYLCVNALFEAEILRKAGIKSPILIIGYTPLADLKRTVQMDCELIVYNEETIEELGKIGLKANVHLKIETGNHRQGIRLADLPKISAELKRYKNIQVAGISTHFADMEDRTNHQYALYQLKEFKKAIHLIQADGHAPRYLHCASTAATVLLPEAHFNFVRLGIGAYGLWPSEKTRLASERAGIEIGLKPALSWKTIVAQVKEVKKGSLVGYGCTYEMPRDGKIAVIPIGYYDGYARALSSKGQVLISGKKAPVIGRICMNMFMADVTDIPGVKLEDEVTLIGQQRKERISAEDVGEWSGTINYEVTTRINERIKRRYI